MAEPLSSGCTPLAMALPRKLCAAAGGMAGLGSAVWLNAAAPFIVYALAVAALAVLAMLVTAAGALLAADWRAKVESHRAWAEIDIAAVEPGRCAGAATPCKIDPVYPQSVRNQALHRLLHAHRFATSPQARAMTQETPAALGYGPVTMAAVPQAAASRKSGAKSAAWSVAATSSCARQKDSATATQTPAMVALHQQRACGLLASPAARPMRLVANAWPERSMRGGGVVTQVAFDRPDVYVVALCGDQDERARPLPEASAAGNVASRSEPPSCRGPPQVVGHRGPATTPAKLPLVESVGPLPAAGVLPTADPVVRDNFGPEVPVRAAELDVIETYLDHVLRDVLASSTADRQEQA